jgi:murein DD-endopeptidase MepM/ murein hydrolase activator NlpD
MTKQRGADRQPGLPFPPDIDPGRPRPPRLPADRPKSSRLAWLAAGVLIVLIAAGYWIFRPDTPSISSSAGGPVAKEPAPSAIPPVSIPKVVEEAIRPGETLSDILQRNGFSPAEIDRMVKQVKPVFNLAKVAAGRMLTLTFDPGESLQTIDYPLDEDQFLRVSREGTDYRAEKKPYPYEIRPAYVQTAIDDHLYGAVLGQGEDAALAIAIEQIFGWDIDFWAGIQPGDAFRLIVEKKYLNGRFRRYGKILAAEFWNDGRRIEAFRFESAEGGRNTSGYYHADGRSLRKEFLKSPLLSYRITSRFTASRLHPIRKVYRAHYGVDYAAPLGTAVFATADGKVEEAGWNGASGRMVGLSHKNGYETMYLHLSRIDVRVGQKVTGGQQIGTVGTSGESTGSHLDYRIKRYGSYLNPLSAKFMPVEPLAAKWMPDFKKRVAGFQLLLDAPLKARPGGF